MSDTVLSKEVFPDPPPALVKYSIHTDELGAMEYLTFNTNWLDKAIILIAKFWRGYPRGREGNG